MIIYSGNTMFVTTATIFILGQLGLAHSGFSLYFGSRMWNKTPYLGASGRTSRGEHRNSIL
jgi:hypothetical protein